MFTLLIIGTIIILQWFNFILIWHAASLIILVSITSLTFRFRRQIGNFLIYTSPIWIPTILIVGFLIYCHWYPPHFIFENLNWLRSTQFWFADWMVPGMREKNWEKVRVSSDAWYAFSETKDFKLAFTVV